jgi:hypothetical protein
MIENHDDQSLTQELQRLFRWEVDAVGEMALPVTRVRTTRPLAVPMLATTAAVVLAAVVIFVSQSGPSIGSPHASATAQASNPVAAAASPSSPPEPSPSPRVAHAGDTFEIGLVEVTDRSGRVTSARMLGTFEFVPAAPQSGLPFAFNPGRTPSADVGVVWSGSTCGPKGGYRITIDEALRSISIATDGEGPWCMDLGTVGIVLEFNGAVDASQLAVSFASK